MASQAMCSPTHNHPSLPAFQPSLPLGNNTHNLHYRRQNFSPRHSPAVTHPRLRRRTCTPTAVTIATGNTATAPTPRGDQHAPEKHGFLHIATVTGPHGLHGDVKATITTDFPAHRLSPSVDIPRFLLIPGRRYPRPTHLLSARSASKPSVYILRFAHVRSRNDIDTSKIRGAKLYIRARDTPPLPRGEFHTASLIDLVVCQRIHHEGEGPVNEYVHYETNTRRHGVVRAGKPIGVIDAVITATDLTAASGGGVSAARVANDLLQIALHNNDNADQEAGGEEDDETLALIPFVWQMVPVVDMTARLVVIDPPPGLLSTTVVNEVSKPRPPRGLLPAAKTT